MRVLQLGKFHPVRGGVEKVMYDLTLGLGERGIDTDMMCAASAGSGGVTQLGPGARLVTCRTWIKTASTNISPTMVSVLRRAVNAYDVVHVHHPDPMAALALRMSGYEGRVILHWHSDILKRKALMQMYLPLQKWILQRADRIVCTSPVPVAQSPWLQGVREKCEVVPIGIEPLRQDSEGSARIREARPGRKIVFFLGRLIGYKGVEYLVKAAKYLPEEYLIAIGGNGPLREQLEHEAKQEGIAGKVEILGGVSERDKAAWFGAADVFCLPSVMKTEAFGIVQIEAMSLGTPVVATRIPGSGTSWVNEQGVSGLNAEIRNPKLLAEAILGVTRSAEAHEAFRRGAKRRFEEHFHIRRMLERMEEIYKG